MIAHVGDVPLQIDQARLQCVQVLRGEVISRGAPVMLECPHRRDDYRRGRTQSRATTRDIDELLRTEVGAESGFGHDIVGETECADGRDNAVAPVGDVRERSSMHESGRSFQGLHEVRRQRVLEQNGHRAFGVQITRIYGFLVACVADHDATQAFFHVVEVGSETEDRHDFRRNDDVEAVFTRIPVSGAAERDGDVSKGSVVHIDHTPPCHPAHVNTERIAVVNVVVDQRSEQIVCETDRVEIPGEVEVDVFHRDYLGVPSAGRATLHAEDRAQ